MNDLNSQSIRFQTISQIGAGFRSGKLTPRGLTDTYLEAIDRLNPLLNCYIAVTADGARAAADIAGRAFQSNSPATTNPLMGIPIGLKDLYDVAGLRTTAGSPIPGPQPATADSFVAAHLREAGTVLLGKHNLHEWALGVTNNNAHFGPCRNPWNPSQAPGGSSGGTGAAIAAGLCVGGFGSDTGGSIRIPASLCGVVGLKPTHGRVSLSGVVPLSWFLDHAGPLARSVEDVALLLAAVDGYDPSDPACVDHLRVNPTSMLADGARGLRMLVCEEHFLSAADSEVSAAVLAAAAVFEKLGGKVERVRLPGVGDLAAANVTLVRPDAAACHRDDIEKRSGQIGPDVLARMKQGEITSATDYSLARRVGQMWRRHFEELLDDRTLLITPTTPITAPPIEGTDALVAAGRLTAFTGPFNTTGLPALSLPCGFSRAGLPIGLQVVGKPWNEAAVLRAGAAYERATEWHAHVPAIH